MRRPAVVLVVSLLVATGCRGSSPAPAGPGVRSSDVSPSGSTELRPELVLRADLSERPAAWKRVFFVPFGDGAAELRYEPSHESGPTQPPSFAMAPDGSFWILDPGKGRVAHYSSSGAFSGDIGAIPGTATDVGFVGERMYVLLNETEGRVAAVRPDGTLTESQVTYEGKPLYVSSLVPSSSCLCARLGGYADDPGTGPQGIASISVPGSVDARLLPGLPVGPGRWIDPAFTGDQTLEVRYAAEAERAVQPIRFELFAGTSDGSSPLPAVAGFLDSAPLDDQVAMSIAIAGASSSVGGRWLLRVGADQSPLLWERLPHPGISDEGQRRRLATGPDGALYLMVPKEDGVEIYRR